MFFIKQAEDQSIIYSLTPAYVTSLHHCVAKQLALFYLMSGVGVWVKICSVCETI